MFKLHPQLAADSHHLGDFKLCCLLLVNDSNYPWLLLVPKRAAISELYQLQTADLKQLQRESINLSRELMRVFAGDKLNVAALGNMVEQLHLHHIVRYKNDIAWPAPVWGAQPPKAYSPAELKAFKQRFDNCNLQQFKPL